MVGKQSNGNTKWKLLDIDIDEALEMKKALDKDMIKICKILSL